jgi:bifunctional DNase/RNase
MVEVVLRAVRVDVGSSTPLLLLEEVGGDRVLPIFVGAPEATAIAYALQNVPTPRPMSHDLLGNVIAALGAQLFAVEITELIDNTYYANLRLLRERTEINVSARPSDAVALALRVGSPILVRDQLMNEQGKVMHLDEADESDEIDVQNDVETNDPAPNEAELVAELRDFLETIRPEDFNQ